MDTYTIEREILPEVVIPSRRLGRHRHHDSRSKNFRVARHASPVSKAWERKTPILDQGNLGSCTGNATVGCLGTEPFYSSLVSLINGSKLDLAEDDAVKCYSRATQLDGFAGDYPPTDTGSDGLSAAKAAQEFGWIGGYEHALSIDDFISGMQTRPGIVGTNWLTGMDTPDSNGMVKYSGTMRGGHEYEAAEVDLTREIVWFWNSWGTGFSLRGKFGMTLADLGKALADGGDATFFTPITEPPPTPTPTPVSDADHVLIGPMDAWAATITSRLTRAGKAKNAYEAWKQAKGY